MHLRIHPARIAGLAAMLLVAAVGPARAQDRAAQQPRPLNKAMPHLSLGVDTTHFDRSVRPQDDFYHFVNGGWLKTATIPADKSRYGSFTLLGDKSDEAIKSIVEDALTAASAPPGTGTQKIRDFYSSYMDTA